MDDQIKDKQWEDIPTSYLKVGLNNSCKFPFGKRPRLLRLSSPFIWEF